MENYWTKQLVIRHVKVSKITRMSLIRHISNFLAKNFLTAKGDAIKTNTPQKTNVISKKENNQSKQILVTYNRIRWIVP